MSRLLSVLFDYETVSSNNIKEIWVSELSRCLRYSFLARRTPVRFNAETLMKMHIGAGLHMRLQKILAKHGFEAEKRVERKTALGFKIVGRIDVYDPSEEAVYELKYTHHLGAIDKVKLSNYLRQLHYYMEMTEAKLGYLIIVHADGQVTEYRRTQRYTDLEARANAFGISVEENILPPRKPKPDSECAECPFFSFCWGGKK
ncbi:Dna2/Cas4 domain-containing protein [Sulfurisphaera ohwakuensis]|uniref:Dna2/Cas4 domain-containing protein n=1 Tax=Sulfurisphaera ohwakuensis TaxID=69656 RepID=UPI0036F439EB